MRHRSHLLLIAGFGLALGLLFWLLRDSGRQPLGDPMKEGGAPAEPAAATSTTPSVAPAVALPSTARTEVAPVEAGGPDQQQGATGSLRVRVVWSDRSNAPDIAVHIAQSRGGIPYRILAREVTGTEGTCRFAELPAGNLEIWTDRGEGEKVEIRAGVEQQATVELPAGIDVEGIVRDTSGRVLPGAGIWLTTHQASWVGGRIIGRSDESGRFRLRAVPKQQSLGALAPGFSPSELADLETLDHSSSPLQVELVVSAVGGGLQGRVVDARGTAVSGALVAVGSAKWHADHRSSGRWVEGWSARTVTTDTEGHYRIESLAPGTQRVEVWVRQHPFWQGECSVPAGGTASLEIQLADGVTVHGLVRSADRAPLAGAVVRAFPTAIRETYLQVGQYGFESIFGYPFAVADAAGRYELGGAAPGRIHLYAAPGAAAFGVGSVPWDAAVLEAADGERLEWNPIVDPGATIEGVVQYRDGTPMDSVFVIAVEEGKERNDADARSIFITDKQGRFRLVRLKQCAYDVEVQLRSPPPDEPPLQRKGVWPGQESLRMVVGYDAPQKLDPGTVRGRVLDAGGRIPGGTERGVVLNTPAGSRLGARWEGDAFRFDRVDPGRYRVSLLAGEDSVYVGPEFELRAGEDRDLGTVVTEPGGVLLVKLRREAGTEAVEPTIYLRHDNGTWRSAKAGMANECRIENLCGGSHRISISARGDAAAAMSACRVVAGIETPVTVRLRRAVLRELVIDYPQGERLSSALVTDSEGQRFLQSQFPRPLPTPHTVRVRLPLGRYVLHAETAAGAVQETSFSVDSLASGQPAVRLTLR